MRLVILGAGSGPRKDYFDRIYLDRFGVAPVRVSYTEFIKLPSKLESVLDERTVLKYDTHDQDLYAIRSLSELGAENCSEEGFAIPSQDNSSPSSFSLESTSSVYFGLCRAIKSAEFIARSVGAFTSHSHSQIELSFDKTKMCQGFRESGLATPGWIGPVEGFDQLVSRMNENCVNRVFIKMRFGSAAAGMIALSRRGDEYLVKTTAMIDGAGSIHATRKLRILKNTCEIAHLVNTLAPFGLHVEKWVPKFGLNNKIVDLRIVVLGNGEAFPVVRSSIHPMTNLHLGGERHSADQVQSALGDSVWQRVMEQVRAASTVFGRCLSMGIDVGIHVCGKKSVLFELNAFGEHIKDMRFGGKLIYEHLFDGLKENNLEMLQR